MDEDKRQDIALFRYGLILPFLSQDELEWGVKGEMLKHIAEKSHTIPHSQRQTVDEETIRKWLALYRDKGFDGLKPKVRDDKGKSRAISEHAWDMAVKLKKEAPRRGVRKIIQMMEAHGIIQPGEIKRSTLARHFNQHQLDRKTLTQVQTAHRRFQAVRPNQLWQSDIMYGPYLPDPKQPPKVKRTYLVAFIDDFSRLVPHAQFYWDEKYPTVEYTLKKAILKRGIPEAIYVDNGKVFSTRKLDAICASLGIRKLSCQPYSPQSKGKIERLFRTLRDQFLVEPEIKQLETLIQLNRLLWAWIEADYHQQIHSSTKMKPLQRWHDNIDAYFRTIDEKELIEIFLYQKTRTVNKAGIVSLQGIEFEVDAMLQNKKVEIRYNPFDLGQINIYYNGQFIQKATPFTIKRWNTKDTVGKTAKELPIKTAIKPLEKLQQLHQKQQTQKAAAITGQKVQLKNQFFTIADFIHCMASSLGKNPEQFHARELELMTTFLKTYPHITADGVAIAVSRIVLKSGDKQHIQTYLDAIKQLYIKWQNR